MLTLLLMRHAKSSWKDPLLADEERPLNNRGKNTADRMGRLLAEHSFTPDVILSSPAKRARQTAKRVRKQVASNTKITKIPALYFQGSLAYLQEVARLSPDVKTALLIGHNPDLESLVARMARRHIDLPTATIVHISIEGNDWSAVMDTKAVKIEVVYKPKDLDTPPSRQKARRPRPWRPTS